MVSSEQERESLVQMLVGLGTGCDENYARQVLQKHGWNADQAATALLDVATVEEEKKGGLSGSGNGSKQVVLDDWITSGALNASPMPTNPRPNSVIDLTGDDDEETSKAIKASMESHPTFGPSNRVDDTQQWAVVPSNAPPTLSQEDKALNFALEASLSSSFVGAAQEIYEEPSDPADRIRKEGWPTALRTTDSAICYAPIVLQCLLSVPQVNECLLRYSVDCEGTEEQHAFAQRLQRLAAISTHTARAYVAVDDQLEPLTSPRPMSNQESVQLLTRECYGVMANQLEYMPYKQGDPWSEIPLMFFQGSETDANGIESSSSYATDSIIDVSVPSPSNNDLMSSLSDTTFSKHEVALTQLSECIAFAVRRQDVAPAIGVEKTPFKYPARMYLDRFMQENSEHANELHNCQEGIQHEIQKFTTDRLKLTNWKNEDTLKNLRSSVQYFESVAADGGDPKRKEAIERTKLKLLGIIKQIEANVQHLDTRIKEFTTDVEGLFDRPNLQKHGYELRAVIMHDGLFGRNHVYSYTKDAKGVWWKIVDYQVSEVSEDQVLNDQTGFHLGAGPILLLYNRISPLDPSLNGGPLPLLPRFTRDIVRQDNASFLAEFPSDALNSVEYRHWLVEEEEEAGTREFPATTSRRSSVDDERTVMVEAVTVA